MHARARMEEAERERLPADPERPREDVDPADALAAAGSLPMPEGQPRGFVPPEPGNAEERPAEDAEERPAEDAEERPAEDDAAGDGSS